MDIFPKALSFLINFAIAIGIIILSLIIIKFVAFWIKHILRIIEKTKQIQLLPKIILFVEPLTNEISKGERNYVKENQKMSVLQESTEDEKEEQLVADEMF